MLLRPVKSVLALTVIVAMTAMLTSCTSHPKEAASPPPGVNAGADGKPAPFREPIRLSSKDGVLEVRLSAHQGTVNLDTVKEPVTNFLVFGYDLIKGTSFGRLDQGRQHVSRADTAGGPWREADRALRQRSSGPDDQGLLRSGDDSQGR